MIAPPVHDAAVRFRMTAPDWSVTPVMVPRVKETGLPLPIVRVVPGPGPPADPRDTCAAPPWIVKPLVTDAPGASNRANAPLTRTDPKENAPPRVTMRRMLPAVVPVTST